MISSSHHLIMSQKQQNTHSPPSCQVPLWPSGQSSRSRIFLPTPPKWETKKQKCNLKIEPRQNGTSPKSSFDGEAQCVTEKYSSQHLMPHAVSISGFANVVPLITRETIKQLIWGILGEEEEGWRDSEDSGGVCRSGSNSPQTIMDCPDPQGNHQGN